MENTPTVCGSDLPTILGILKNDGKSRSVNNSLQPLNLEPNRIQYFFYQSKLRPVKQTKNKQQCTASVHVWKHIQIRNYTCKCIEMFWHRHHHPMHICTNLHKSRLHVRINQYKSSQMHIVLQGLVKLAASHTAPLSADLTWLFKTRCLESTMVKVRRSQQLRSVTRFAGSHVGQSCESKYAKT